MEVKDKIEVGEYIKLKRGDIFKIDEDTTNYYNSNKEFITNEIAKHSKNIIDLIEVGDYVNGEKVNKNKYGELYIGYVYAGGEIGKTLEAYATFIEDIKEEYIESIVTKEQFKEMEYRV